MGPLTAVKQELLVRYLDAWLPVALHGHKRVSLVCQTGSTELVAAVHGVLSELADLLERHELTLVTTMPVPAVPGVTVAATWSPRFGLPLAFLDGGDELLPAIVSVRGAEVLAFLPGEVDPGTPLRCVAELVAADSTVQTLVFGTSSEKALDKFKDELWALDEFAGVQLRDPADPELLDIALRPHPGPLRRMIAARLAHQPEVTVRELRDWTLRHTVYRAADAVPALQLMLAAGEVRRSPETGRLGPATVICAAEPGM